MKIPRLDRAFRWLLVLLTLFAAGWWLAGRVLTDRFLWSQYLFWTPAWLTLLGGMLMWGLYAVLLRLTRARAAAGRAERWSAVLALTALLIGVAHAAFVEYRLTRFVWHAARPAGGKPTLRVALWNAMAPDLQPGPHIPEQIIDELDPDLFFFASRMSSADALPNTVKPLAGRYHYAGVGVYIGVSKFPILSQRFFSLGLNDPVARGTRPSEPGPAYLPPPATESRRWFERFYNRVLTRLGLPPRYFRDVDPGHLMVLKLDTAQTLGRPMVVWYLDLPSDPIDHKREMARRIAARLAAIRETDAAGNTGESIGEPDLIIGDFNLPRGSGSVALFAPGLTNAYDQAGRGVSASWPRAWPTLQIDQALVGPGLRATGHRLQDMGATDHLALVLELTPAD